MKKILATKKFLVVITLVGVVISQIFFSSLAEAFNEGDVLEVKFYRCVSHRPYVGCGKIARVIKNFDTGEVLLNELENFSDMHLFDNLGYIRYVYRNGQWIELVRYFY